MNFIHTHKVNSGEYIFGEFEIEKKTIQIQQKRFLLDYQKHSKKPTL